MGIGIEAMQWTDDSLTTIFSSPEKAEKVDEFIRNENVLLTMERRQLKKQRSRLQSKGEADAPKLKYAPAPPPLPPPPAAPAVAKIIKKKTDGEDQAVSKPAMDLTQEIVQRRTTLREEREGET